MLKAAPVLESQERLPFSRFTAFINACLALSSCIDALTVRLLLDY